MLPSDHFVLFYNEVFKYLSAQGVDELRKYYDRISQNQEKHCLKLFCEKGLHGMYEYWEHIKHEENCDMENYLSDDCYSFKFFSCPSLSKVLKCDAGAYQDYCKHCPGWILPLMSKCGFFAVYNLIDCKCPQCEMYVHKDKNSATVKAEKLIAKYGKNVILTNFVLESLNG